MTSAFKFSPGDHIPHLKVLGENAREQRRLAHRNAVLWVLTFSTTEHYLLQCAQALDRHVVLGAFASLDLAHIARGAFEKLVKMASATGEGAAASRLLARAASVRWREAA